MDTTSSLTRIADHDAYWRAAATELTEQVRAVTRAAAMTAVDEATLRESAVQLREVVNELSRTSRQTVLVGDFGREPRELTGTRRIGDHNALVIPLTVTAAESSAFATWRADEMYEGSGGVLHGGTAAWLMDCMFGLLLEESGTVGRTANLTVDYKAPIPVSRELHLRSTIEQRDGRKIWVAGTIEVDEQVALSAHGLFIIPREGTT